MYVCMLYGCMDSIHEIDLIVVANVKEAFALDSLILLRGGDGFARLYGSSPLT